MLFFKIIVFIIMILGYFFCVDTIEPLIQNSISMSQMGNDSFNYVLLRGYPYIKGIYVIALAIIAIVIIIDLIEKYKNKKEKKNED